MASVSGATLGRYTLLKRLASSGDAEVLLARASGAAGFEHHVVIKRMRAQPGTDPQAISRFLDELRLAGSLHHHHIVQVHDAGREGHDYYFAMEYVHGENLRKILTRVVKRDEQIPLEHVVTIGLAIAQALHHAHEQRTPEGRPLELVHRDVSPANVIVGYDGTVKVVDFGVAKAAVSSAQTKAGTLRGKAPYMAPEQCAGRPLDRRADIFALGIVLWELCTARRLFKGANDFMTMAAIVSGKIVPPSKLRPDLPADFEKIILKALSLRPEGRYATAMEMCVALEDMATNNIIRISQAALATYLKELFGVRPEPWLVDGDDTSGEGLEVDFDGENGGVVRVTKEQVMNLDAVREVTAAHASEPSDYDEDEFDEEPMTELVDSEAVAAGAPTDLREIAAAVEAAKLLRMGSAPDPQVTTPAATPPPALPSTMPAAPAAPLLVRPSAAPAAPTPPPARPSAAPAARPAAKPPARAPLFNEDTDTANPAEVDRLRKISAQLAGEPLPDPPRPAGTAPPPASAPPRPASPASTSPQPSPPAGDGPPALPVLAPASQFPDVPTAPSDARPVMLSQSNVKSAPMAWDGVTRSESQTSPAARVRWPLLIAVAVVGLVTGVLLIDLLLG